VFVSFSTIFMYNIHIYIYIHESYPQDLHWQATCYRNLTRLPIAWRPQLSSWPLATRRKRAPAQKYETYGDKRKIFLLVINLWWFNLLIYIFVGDKPTFGDKPLIFVYFWTGY
jgi:hypothetical protein